MDRHCLNSARYLKRLDWADVFQCSNRSNHDAAIQCNVVRICNANCWSFILVNTPVWKNLVLFWSIHPLHTCIHVWNRCCLRHSMCLDWADNLQKRCRLYSKVTRTAAIYRPRCTFHDAFSILNDRVLKLHRYELHFYETVPGNSWHLAEAY